MGTQWRVGPSGPTGLDYSALVSVMHFERISKKHQPEIFECIRVMEDAALAVIHEED